MFRDGYQFETPWFLELRTRKPGLRQKPGSPEHPFTEVESEFVRRLSRSRVEEVPQKESGVARSRDNQRKRFEPTTV